MTKGLNPGQQKHKLDDLMDGLLNQMNVYCGDMEKFDCTQGTT